MRDDDDDFADNQEFRHDLDEVKSKEINLNLNGKYLYEFISVFLFKNTFLALSTEEA